MKPFAQGAFQEGVSGSVVTCEEMRKEEGLLSHVPQESSQDFLILVFTFAAWYCVAGRDFLAVAYARLSAEHG
jgi:hypothetical protein